MPPSGYSASQAGYIRNFLLSCADALAREAVEFNNTYVQRLRKEIADIKRYLDEPGLELSQVSILKLTSTFYVRLLGESPDSETEFKVAARKSAVFVSDNILAIHIEPLAQESI